MSTIVQVGLLLLVFSAVTVIAELAGAANLGTAMGIASVAFAAALLALLLIPGRSGRER